MVRRSFLLLLHLYAVQGLPRLGVFGAVNVKRSNDDEERPSRQDDAADDESSWLDDLELEDGPEIDPSRTQASYSQEAFDTTLQSHPLLQIPCRLTLSGTTTSSNPDTYCDTGAQRSVMSYAAAQQMGLLQHLDRRYAGEALGVGSSCRVLGRLPAGLIAMHLGSVQVPAPAITVLESATGPEFLLGLDFLREHAAILDLAGDELQLVIGGRRVGIPFVRPRSPHDPDMDAAKDACLRESRYRCDDNDESDYEDYDDENCPLDMSGI